MRHPKDDSYPRPTPKQPPASTLPPSVLIYTTAFLFLVLGVFLISYPCQPAALATHIHPPHPPHFPDNRLHPQVWLTPYTSAARAADVKQEDRGGGGRAVLCWHDGGVRGWGGAEGEDPISVCERAGAIDG